MLTVPQAAERIGRNPETIRRWIRSGRLRSRRVGTQHLAAEEDLDAPRGAEDTTPLPEWLRVLPDGRPQPAWVRILREQRRGH